MKGDHQKVGRKSLLSQEKTGIKMLLRQRKENGITTDIDPYCLGKLITENQLNCDFLKILIGGYFYF